MLRLRTVTGVAVALVLIAGASLAWMRQPPDPVTVADAVSRFRDATTSTSEAVTPGPVDVTAPLAASADTPATTAPPQAGADVDADPASGANPTVEPAPAPPSPEDAPTALPADGVYVYDTSGFEETDALGGVRRDYPSQSTLTVQHTDCGWTMRWQPLNERFDEWAACAEGAQRTMERYTTYHEFYGKGQRDDFDCVQNGQRSQWLPAAREPGTTWTWHCENETSAADSAASVVAIETIDVGGTVVEAVHVRYDNTLSGGNDGRQVLEFWCHPDTGLPVRMVQQIDVRGDSPFGKINYREEYTLELTSLEPQR